MPEVRLKDIINFLRIRYEHDSELFGNLDIALQEHVMILHVFADTSRISVGVGRYPLGHWGEWQQCLGRTFAKAIKVSIWVVYHDNQGHQRSGPTF